MSLSEAMPFTEFIQRPTAAIGRLSRARVLLLRRRDEDDLVVMPADRAAREGEFVELTARLLASLLRHDNGQILIRQALPDVLPWVRFLPQDDVDVLVREFVEAAEASASVDNAAPVAQLLVEWQHTAEVHADPELYARLSAPTGDDYGPATPPEGDG